MKNRGKIFEDNFKRSVPEEILYERFKDGTANFNGNMNNNVRFQAKNVCDCFVYDGSILLYLELKSHKGKSVPLNCIRENQTKELLKRQEYKNTIAGLLIEFSDLERVFYINIRDFNNFINDSNNNRKSIPFEWCRDVGIEVEIKKLRTNYRYNVKKMYEDIINRDF